MATKKAKSTPKKLSRTSTEQTMGKIQKALAGKHFATMGDLNKFLSTLTGPGSFGAPGDIELSDKEAAQELAFDAMEAESAAQARKLAKRALALDPDCVDALVVLTELDADSPRKAIEGLRKAVEAGERSLGAAFIRKNTGHFWALLETRPWMRALESLAEAYRSQGIHLDAIRIYERMLELNPNDNQGVRDLLLGLYLVVGDLSGAGRLLEKYKNDSMANFAWGRVLERYLSGDEDGAVKALKAACQTNEHVVLYLTGQRKLPNALPELYSPGSEEEAVLCIDTLGAAWAGHMEALIWLAEQCVSGPSAADDSKPTRTKKRTARSRIQ
jgi:tetratricopeptide (TPR) repeat protein